MKRVITSDKIERAYQLEDFKESLVDEKIEDFQKKTKKIPKEIFTIVGDLVSFIEEANNLEGKK